MRDYLARILPGCHMLNTVYRVWFYPNFDPDARLIYLDFINDAIAASVAEQYRATLVEQVAVDDSQLEGSQPELAVVA
jgi:hypothetical protein